MAIDIRKQQATPPPRPPATETDAAEPEKPKRKVPLWAKVGAVAGVLALPVAGVVVKAVGGDSEGTGRPAVSQPEASQPEIQTEASLAEQLRQSEYWTTQPELPTSDDPAELAKQIINLWEWNRNTGRGAEFLVVNMDSDFGRTLVRQAQEYTDARVTSGPLYGIDMDVNPDIPVVEVEPYQPGQDQRVLRFNYAQTPAYLDVGSGGRPTPISEGEPETNGVELTLKKLPDGVWHVSYHSPLGD